jgi:hypothetical protein
MAARSIRRTLVAALIVLAGTSAQPRAQTPEPDPLAALLAALEQLVQSPSGELLARVAAPDDSRASVAEFLAPWQRDGITRVVIHARDRADDADGMARSIVEVMIEQGDYARVATWQIDTRQVGQEPRIVAIHAMGAVDGLYRLSLEKARQYAAVKLTIAVEDFTVSMPNGAVFAVPAGSGITALVLVGRGEMTFRPSPETERGQVRIYAGADTLRTSFDAVFVRLNPLAFESLVSSASLTPRQADARAVRQAQEIFREQLPRSFSVDLADLSRDTWSLLPSFEDVLIDVDTRRFGTLTYARASNEPEDITVFDRERRKTIAVYRSKERLAAEGPFYDEDDLADFDVVDRAVDVTFSPERLWFDGRARLQLRVRAQMIASVTLRLASSLVVRTVTSEQHGRLLFLRVRNQDSLIVNLPSPLARDTELTLHVVYAGRLEPVEIDREAARAGQIARPSDSGPVLVPEPSFLYSNRGYWYPQSNITDYAPATIRVTLPAAFTAVCSGEPAQGSPVALRTPAGERQLFVFSTPKPVRYLGCVFARFGPGETRTFQLGAPSHAAAPATNGSRKTFTLTGRSPARQRGRTRDLLDEAEDIIRFYTGLMNDAPFPSFTLALVESDLPGGQSPAYFAALNQPLPTSPYTWRNDPASFDNYPEFFLAHELAHQWWGHAVGWNSYHEQWLSEGFAQYFAALYAERRRGPDVFANIIRTMNRWAVSMSPQGPVFLGYRLGHLQGDSRIFRALVYNKGAMVLHMLRRLVGDDVFFAALRRFYTAHPFTKAGTADLQKAFEEETGRNLQVFFDGWIHGADLPVVNVSTKTEDGHGGQEIVVRVQQTGRVFEFPLTVSVQFAGGSSRDYVVRVFGRTTEERIPVSQRVRKIEVNRDRATLLGGRD